MVFQVVFMPTCFQLNRAPDDAAAKYDADTRSFVVTVPKKNKGEVFLGLDLLTELLRPKDGAVAAGIEEVGGYSAPGEEDEEEIDWYFEQQIPEEGEERENSKSDGYGFAFGQSGVFSRLGEEAAEMLDVKNPDELTHAQRREVRAEMESACFDPDHYLCDLFESDEVRHPFSKACLQHSQTAIQPLYVVHVLCL